MSIATSTILDRRTGVPSDAAAIAELQASIALQAAAFRRDPYPSAAERIEHLGALAAMMMGNRKRIQEAVAEDFGSHPTEFTDLIEILAPAGRAAYAIESLTDWMAPSGRPADPALYGNAEASMRYEPKGVIGNMVPWNFPFEIACGPVVEMLAAGNRVVIKPSDLTPACGEVLADMVAATFERDRVTVAVGGLELAKEFSRQPWNHLLYTGSPGIGREVMRGAAENLVPVTLELGGKCPAILTSSGVTPAAVESIMGTKLIKNGQMCISVDHVLVRREDMDAFVELALRFVRASVPDFSRTDDCAGIISDRHVERIEELIAEARSAGARIVEVEPGVGADPATRQMPLTLIVDPDPGLRICREEIFGPILPVIPYDRLDDAIAAIDAEGRPLALYIFGDNTEECEAIARAARSGGVCINGCAVQAALPSLGFGGSGSSGMGRHHGIEGFREFSTARGVVVRGEPDNIDVLYPPYGDKVRGIVYAAFAP